MQPILKLGCLQQQLVAHTSHHRRELLQPSFPTLIASTMNTTMVVREPSAFSFLDLPASKTCSQYVPRHSPNTLQSCEIVYTSLSPLAMASPWYYGPSNIFRTTLLWALTCQSCHIAWIWHRSAARYDRSITPLIFTMPPSPSVSAITTGSSAPPTSQTSARLKACGSFIYASDDTIASSQHTVPYQDSRRHHFSRPTAFAVSVSQVTRHASLIQARMCGRCRGRLAGPMQ